MAILTCLVIIAVGCYLWFRSHFSYWQKRNIANVAGFFSGGFRNIITLKTNFGYHLNDIYSNPTFQNEPVVGIYALQRPALLIRDPDLLKSILIKDFDHFKDRFAWNDPHHDPIGGLALMFCRYNFWKDIRSKVSPIFTSGKMRHMYPLIQAVAEHLEKHLQKEGSRFIIEMKDIAGLFTTEVINTTIFGIHSNALSNPQEDLAVEVRRIAQFNWKRAFNLMVIFLMPQLTGFFKAKVYYKETDDFLRNSINCVISERERTGIKRNDLIDIFVKLKQDAVANGEDITAFMNAITAQAGIFMFGGYETSSTTISNMLMELAKNRDIQDKLRRELEQAFGEGKGELSYEALNNLKYLGMVTDETLRMYPPLPLIERKHNLSTEGNAFSLMPHSAFNLPDNMTCYISIYGLHHDPKYWPNPQVFDPERFLPKNKSARHPMTFLPFGNGPRNCVGARLGLIEVKICVAYFLKNHFVQLCDKTNLQPRFDNKAVVLQIEGGVYLEVVRDDMYDK